MAPPRIPIEERFWAKVNKRGPFPENKRLGRCWVWTGASHKSGKALYGTVWMDSRNHPAHRIALLLDGQPFVAGKQVDHICENTLCVRPSHLRYTTSRINTLRSKTSAAAVNARKTHCKRGHKFTPSNTVIYKDNKRRCRRCVNEYSREYQRSIYIPKGDR